MDCCLTDGSVAKNNRCDVLNLDYDRYDYVERERRDHPYSDSFYMPPMHAPLYICGALIEQALDDPEINTLHLADLSCFGRLSNQDGGEEEQDEEEDEDEGSLKSVWPLLLELVRSRTWKFIELGARFEKGVQPMLDVLTELIQLDNCQGLAAGCRFQARTVCQLVTKWIRVSETNLEYIKLFGVLQDSQTALELADAVVSSKSLRKVEFGHLSVPSNIQQRLAKAVLLENPRMDLLYLYYSESHVQPVEHAWETILQRRTEECNKGCDKKIPFLYAYIRDCRPYQLERLLENNLVQHLHVRRGTGMLPYIAKGLQENTTLKILDLSGYDYQANDLVALWKSVEHHPALELISFSRAAFHFHVPMKKDVELPEVLFVGAGYLAGEFPPMAGIVRVLVCNRSRWLRDVGGNGSPTTAWPTVLERIQSQLDGLARVETLYYLLRHRLDWILHRN